MHIEAFGFMVFPSDEKTTIVYSEAECHMHMLLLCSSHGQENA
jgi:hypothetical protein